ncbi:MAG TPA: glucose 1-dehydrogenase [Dehalococcoidia bacterium]|nr:glucose 1-dehydrogenase [Dehalococcoidia bacterium]
MGRLDGKVALITGGARGQGAAEGRLFAAEGAGVVLTDVLDTEGEATAKACGGVYLHHDVTSAEQWERVVSAALDRHGRLDILVNNAGIWMTGRLTDTTEADYRRVIDVNQVGVFLGMQAASKPMMAARSGAIVNISSIAGMRGAAAGFAYGASKWAVRGMTKSAAQELGRFGIRVNSIHPGLIDTAMLHQLPGIDAGGLENRLRSIPLGRVGEAEDVAKLALFLASDDSAYSSGHEFIIDGALTA